jgi:hypothetical protein
MMPLSRANAPRSGEDLHLLERLFFRHGLGDAVRAHFDAG